MVKYYPAVKTEVMFYTICKIYVTNEVIIITSYFIQVFLNSCIFFSCMDVYLVLECILNFGEILTNCPLENDLTI